MKKTSIKKGQIEWLLLKNCKDVNKLLKQFYQVHIKKIKILPYKDFVEIPIR